MKIDAGQAKFEEFTLNFLKYLKFSKPMIRKGVLLPDSPISGAMLNIEGGEGYVQNPSSVLCYKRITRH